jgi:hypothetical protein
VLFAATCAAQFGNDSVILVKSNPFFLDLIKKKYSHSAVYSGDIKLYAKGENFIPFPHPGEFISLPSVGFFFHLYNTGRIYKLDTSSLLDSFLLFKRIDRTVNFYYNIGSFLFGHEKQIFDFGGYGFWKSNGLMRKYNYQDKEWDIVELNKEIFPPSTISDSYVTWVDSSQRFLYVPYQEIRNDGLSSLGENDELEMKSHRLNFNNYEWEELGELDEQVFENMKFASHIFHSKKGLLLIYTNRVYWVDYLNNQLKVTFDPTLSQTILRIQRYMLRYWNNEHIYWFNPVNGTYDSVRIELSKFRYDGQVIWKKSFHLKEFILMAALIIVLAIFFLIQFRSSKKPVDTNEEFIEHGAPFSGTELALLSLLLSKHKIGKTATIPEINYVLGLKDKNHGMQKKVRSEIINKINEKYLLISKGKEMLIQNIRSESDKRFFEYLINPELVEHLRKLTAQST